MTLSASFLDELRARTTLSTLINRDVPLKKAGPEWRACCPFHNEKSPSFYVNDCKAFYHCFGCGAHGDAIRWLTDHKGMPFMDAVKELAASAGMDMPARSAGDDQREAEFEILRGVMARAAAFYSTELRQFGADACQQYLTERDISPDLARLFDLGWAPNSRKGEKSKLETEFRDVADETLIKLGLRRANDSGEIYDFFRGRLMFPIHDSRGRVIGFGGRVIGKGEPKYLNSPDTPLFDKGRTLFNHHRAQPAARKAGRLLIVEGYMDVIGLARVDILEVVAPNGTALTERQILMAWRMSDTPIICFDGDAAGRRAAARAAMTALPMLEPGRSLSFAFLPAGADPDDIVRAEGRAGRFDTEEIRAGGRDAFNAGVAANTKPLVDVLWETELTKAPIDTPEQRAGFWTRLRQCVGTIRDDAVRAAYLDDMTARYQAQFKRGGREAERAAPAGKASLSVALEATVVAGLMKYPAVAARDYEGLMEIAWRYPDIRRVVGVIVDVVIEARGAAVTFEVLAAHMARANVSDIAMRITLAATMPFGFMRAGADEANAIAELTDVLAKMPRR